MIDVDLDKQFTVCTLSRHDLKQMGLSDAEIEATRACRRSPRASAAFSKTTKATR